MPLRLAVLIFALALSLSAETKTETHLKSEVEALAKTITAQNSIISDLRLQLSAARIQTATANGAAAAANGVASGSSAAVVDLKSEVAVAHSQTEQANNAASASTEKVADLQSQLAASNVQTATAKVVASETKATLNAHRAKDSAVLRTGSDASIAGAKLAAEAVRLGAENRAALLKLAPKVDTDTDAINRLKEIVVVLSRLLVAMCLALLAQIPIVAAIVVKVRRKEWLTTKQTTTS